MKTIFTKAHITKQNDDNTFTAVASTATVDRHGEIVSVEGWDLKNFKKNPVLLWSHDHTIPAIGIATRVWVDKTGKEAKLMFKGAWQTVTEYGKAAAELSSMGILNTFSVGFIPKDMVDNKYTAQELLEISLVNVPANPDAVMLAYKSLTDKGFGEDVAKTVVQQFVGMTEVRKDLFENVDRGAVQDELDEEAMWEAKRKNMKDAFDVFYAFCDVYFDSETPVEDFKVIGEEMISILAKVFDGTFNNPIDEKVVDNESDKNKTEDNKVKVPQATAPKIPEKTIRNRQTLTKAIVKASDFLLEDKSKLKDEESIKLIKAIKRAGEILSKSHKGEMKNGSSSRFNGEES